MIQRFTAAAFRPWAKCRREAQDAQLAAWLWQWSATAVGLLPADDLPPSKAGQ